MFINAGGAAKMAQEIARKEARKKAAKARAGGKSKPASDDMSFYTARTSVSTTSMLKKTKSKSNPPENIRSVRVEPEFVAPSSISLVSPEESLLLSIQRAIEILQEQIYDYEKSQNDVLSRAKTRLECCNEAGAIISMRKMDRIQQERNRVLKAVAYLQQQEVDMRAQIQDHQVNKNYHQANKNYHHVLRQEQSDESASSISFGGPDYEHLEFLTSHLIHILSGSNNNNNNNNSNTSNTTPSDQELLLKLKKQEPLLVVASE